MWIELDAHVLISYVVWRTRSKGINVTEEALTAALASSHPHDACKINRPSEEYSKACTTVADSQPDEHCANSEKRISTEGFDRFMSAYRLSATNRSSTTSAEGSASLPLGKRKRKTFLSISAFCGSSSRFSSTSAGKKTSTNSTAASSPSGNSMNSNEQSAASVVFPHRRKKSYFVNPHLKK